MKVLIYNKKYLLEIMYLPHNVYYAVFKGVLEK